MYLRLILKLTLSVTRKFSKVTLDIKGSFETYTRYSVVSNEEHIGKHIILFFDLECTDFD